MTKEQMYAAAITALVAVVVALWVRLQKQEKMLYHIVQEVLRVLCSRDNNETEVLSRLFQLRKKMEA